MAKLTIDVDGADRTIAQIKRDLHRGMEKTVDTLVDNARSEARRVISEERAIFNSEVYAGFKDAEVNNTPTTVRKKLYNDVEHADPLEEGATYTDSGPPVQALLPWVARKMRVGSSFDPDSYNGSGDGGSGDNQSSSGSLKEKSVSLKDKIFNTQREDVTVGNSYFIYDSSGVTRRLEVAEKNQDTFDAISGGGDRFEFNYDQIASEVNDGPVSERIDEFETGDRVKFYDPDEDEFLDIILTGETDFSGEKYNGILKQDGNEIEVQIHQGKFVEWDSSPDIDSSIVKDKMRDVSVDDYIDARSENIHPKQEVVIYDPMEGTTKPGLVSKNPWRGEVVVEYSGGKTGPIKDTDWEIRYALDFSELDKNEKLDRIETHIDYLNVNGGTDSDLEFLSDYIKDNLLNNYTDDEKFARTLFSFTELNINQKRPHAGNAKIGDGWELQVKPKPNNSNPIDINYWKLTASHEFGHGYNKATDGNQVQYNGDPEEYDLASPWPNRNDNSYSHMYQDGLPDWEFFGSNNPFHGFKEMYMFTDEDILNKVSYANGSIQLDSRDSLNPYGVNEWGDDVQALARADAKGEKLSIRNSKIKTTELTEKQVFGGDEPSIDPGEYVSFEIDGENVVHEFENRDGLPTTFAENPNDPNIPTSAEAYGFNTLDGSRNGKYIANGEVYDAVYDADAELYYLEKDDSFIGTSNLINYDESLDEFPELVETDDDKRLQEAANMAWWYQVNFIEADESNDKEDSFDKVLRNGYSATRGEEVMSTFTEGLADPNPSNQVIDDFKTVVNEYPFFIRELLKQRQPVSEEAEDILKANGFL